MKVYVVFSKYGSVALFIHYKDAIDYISCKKDYKVVEIDVEDIHDYF